jgi:hypothetical protein
MYIEREFRCLKCGQAGIPLMRNRGYQHSGGHRKKLYCYHCKTEVNHIEIKTIEDREEFLENWAKGVYKDEAEASVSLVGVSGMR